MVHGLFVMMLPTLLIPSALRSQILPFAHVYFSTSSELLYILYSFWFSMMLQGYMPSQLPLWVTTM